MTRNLRTFTAFIMVSCVLIFQTPLSYAAKTGSVCKKLNAKSWDGDIPIICAKKKNKLIWVQFIPKVESNKNPLLSPSPTPSQRTDILTITLIGIQSTFTTKEMENAMLICRTGIYKYPDINSKTGIEIRDSGGSIIAISNLGEPTIVDNSGSSLGNCVFNSKIELKKSDFYQIKIGRRFDSTYSYMELESKKWQIALTIGS